MSIQTSRNVEHFPVWMTVEVGAYGNWSAYRKAIRAVDGHISHGVSNAVMWAKFLKEKTTIELVQVAIRDFGITHTTHHREACERILSTGLVCAPPETSFAYCLLAPKLPKVPYRGLNFVYRSNTGTFGTFRVGWVPKGNKPKELWLSGGPLYGGAHWAADQCVIFAKPYK